MGIPLMIQAHDNKQIEHLKKDLGIHTKIDVIRAGLNLLEKEVARLKRMRRWASAAKLVSENSQQVNQAFQKHSLLKDIE